jgi:hypothetical protein
MAQCQLGQSRSGQYQLDQCQPGPCQPDRYQPDRSHPDQCQLSQCQSGPGQRHARRNIEVLPCGTVHLFACYFCCRSYIIYHVLLLLSATLAIGCPLFSRLLIPSQAKLVAVKRHRRQGRLRPDTVANDSVGDSVHGALVTDTTLEFFAFSAKFCYTVSRGTFFMAVAVALSVAGIVFVLTALVGTICDGSVSSWEQSHCHHPPLQ